MRNALLRAWRNSISVSDLAKLCRLCLVPHPDVTPSECRRWAESRLAWLEAELARLRIALGGGKR